MTGIIESRMARRDAAGRGSNYGFFPSLWSCLIAFALSACSASNREERHWTEDVRLDDGTTIQIERRVSFDESNSLGGGTYNAVESAATLQFLGDLATLPAWSSPRMALVLYRSKESHNWIVVATSTSCEVWGSNGMPRPPYWEYELLNEKWREVPLRQESIGRVPNLFYLYAGQKFSSHVTEREKVELQSDGRIADKYRTILSEPRDFHCM